VGISCVTVLNKFGSPGYPTSLTPTHKIWVNEQKNTECRGKCIYTELWGRTVRVITAVEHFIHWQ